MSPMKVMPLLLTCITPFVMVSGTARAAEPQIILAQAQNAAAAGRRAQKEATAATAAAARAGPTATATAAAQQPQQPQPHNAQGAQPPQQHNAQEQQKQAQEQQQKALEQQQHLQQQKAQEQQHLQQQKQAQEQQQKDSGAAAPATTAQQQHRSSSSAQEQLKSSSSNAHSSINSQNAAAARKQAQEQQQKALEQQQHLQHQRPSEKAGSEHSKRRAAAPASAGASETAGSPAQGSGRRSHQERPGEDQQLQEQQRHTEQELQLERQRAAMQQQQAHQQQTALRHELSAEDQKAKAERDAHQADRQKLIEREQQMAAAEHSQAAINERLRLQNERLRAITSQRREMVDAGGHKYIQEPGNRTIFTVNNQTFIRHDESVNFPFVRRKRTDTARAERQHGLDHLPPGRQPHRGRGRHRTAGPMRRVRYLPDGRRFVLFENRAIAAGIGLAALGAFVVTLPPAQIDIPRGEYIVDAGVASEDDIYGALQAPPVEPLDRTYSLDEVLASVSLRERMRSISIDTIHFEFGSAEIGPEQAVMLESVAAAIRDAANANPGEVFLIEGHTDAVGSDQDNLSLSDRRAQAIADALSQQFGVPRENLVTQGYGKQFLLDSDRWAGTPEPACGCQTYLAASPRGAKPLQRQRIWRARRRGPVARVRSGEADGTSASLPGGLWIS